VEPNSNQLKHSSLFHKTRIKKRANPTNQKAKTSNHSPKICQTLDWPYKISVCFQTAVRVESCRRASLATLFNPNPMLNKLLLDNLRFKNSAQVFRVAPPQTFYNQPK
jgi:hypothetical protein